MAMTKPLVTAAWILPRGITTGELASATSTTMSGRVPTSHTIGHSDRHTPSQRSSASSARVKPSTTASVVAVYITRDATPTSMKISETR